MKRRGENGSERSTRPPTRASWATRCGAKVASGGVSVTVKAQDIPDNWVTGAVPIADGKVLIFTSKEKPSPNTGG